MLTGWILSPFVLSCRKLYYLVQSKRFEFAIMIVIIANSALMATSFYNQPETMKQVVEAMNYAFTGVYVVELLLKVTWNVRRGSMHDCSTLCLLIWPVNVLACLLNACLSFGGSDTTCNDVMTRYLPTGWWPWLDELLEKQLEQV